MNALRFPQSPRKFFSADFLPPGFHHSRLSMGSRRILSSSKDLYHSLVDWKIYVFILTEYLFTVKCFFAFLSAFLCLFCVLFYIYALYAFNCNFDTRECNDPRGKHNRSQYRGNTEKSDPNPRRNPRKSNSGTGGKSGVTSSLHCIPHSTLTPRPRPNRYRYISSTETPLIFSRASRYKRSCGRYRLTISFGSGIPS